jgi:hypothetical protein
MKDAESGKMKDKVSGLGKWRCSGCRKACKVTRHAPVPKEIVAAVRAINTTSVVPAPGQSIDFVPEVPSAPTQS